MIDVHTEDKIKVNYMFCRVENDINSIFFYFLPISFLQRKKCNRNNMRNNNINLFVISYALITC
jgi:hypothetical protein